MKRVILTRFGFFQEEGSQKGHLDLIGLQQMQAIAEQIQQIPISDKSKAIIFCSTNVISIESAKAIRKALSLSKGVVPSGEWKAAPEESKERKAIVQEIVEKSEKYDLIIIVTNSQTLNDLWKNFLENKYFKDFEVVKKPEDAKEFGSNFLNSKFGFEASWQAESPLLTIEEISVNI